MFRLNEPYFSFKDALEECIAGITGNALLAEKVGAAKDSLLAKELDYVAAANTGELHAIAPIDTTFDPDPVTIENLTKSELIKVYDSYFVPKNKPARAIYDSLLNAAKEKCPFCGGIGTPRNLDHFLPKAHFPHFSVLPRNLVPACRDCNMDGKGQEFAANAADQIIQPYLDKDLFFQDQWVFATYYPEENQEPGRFEYFVSAPLEWLDLDKERAKKHFHDFNLARRYATKAAESVATVLKQIVSLRAVGLSAQEIKEALLTPGIEEVPFANHWQKGMYQALANWIEL